MTMTDLGWWTIHGEEMLQMMKRAANGEDPGLLYAELYANSEHHYYPADE